MAGVRRLLIPLAFDLTIVDGQGPSPASARSRAPPGRRRRTGALSGGAACLKGAAVKLSVIALDYDGTIARHDALDPSVRASIGAARARGITVIVVTGRRLSELRRVAGDLRFADGVIAENGAVLHFPDSGHTSLLAPPLSPVFAAEVQRRGLHVGIGESLVDAGAVDAPQLLGIIRTLEVPLVLLFNSGRVMVLPQGVSKATGLRAALDTLRLSARNTLAIGDAENDHELLRLAEVGAAVEWGSPALRAVADLVVPGSGPPDVASFVQAVAATGQLPPVPRARRRLLLGCSDDGREFSLAVRGRNILVAGDARSGKSWIAGLLCEQLIRHGYCVCAIDAEGDYRSLEALPGVTVLGGEDPPPSLRDLMRALRYPDRSVVIDLSHRAQDEKIEYIRGVLPALNRIRRETGLPHRILLDEAHYFLQDASARHLLDFERNGYMVVTYWASRLPKDLLAATEVMIVTRESNPAEVEALRQWCPTCQQVGPEGWGILAHLRAGQAAALPLTEEAGGDIRVFTMAPRITPHVRHREKYVDVPVSDQRAFVFGPRAGQAARRAQTLRQFVAALEAMPVGDLEGYLARGDFSRWINDVFGDYCLAATVHALEAAHRGRRAPDTVQEIVAAVRDRYELVSVSGTGT